MKKEYYSESNPTSLFFAGTFIFFVGGFLNAIGLILKYQPIFRLITYAAIGILFLAFANYYLQRQSLMSVGSWLVVFASFLINFVSFRLFGNCVFSFGLILFFTGFLQYENAKLHPIVLTTMILWGLQGIPSLVLMILARGSFRGAISEICGLIGVIAFFVTALLMRTIYRFMVVKTKEE